VRARPLAGAATARASSRVTLFEGADLLLAHAPVAGARTIVATFSNFTADGTLDYFGAGYLERRGFSVLHFVARRNMWWQTPEMEPALAASRRLLRDATHVVAYGASMGGYGALLFAADLGAEHVLAASPQLRISDPALLRPEWADAIGRQPILRDDVAATLTDCRVDVVFDPVDPLDAAHARLLEAACARNGVPLRRYLTPFAGHRSLEHLQRSNLLSGLVRRMITGELTVAEFRAAVRTSRPRNPAYAERARILLDRRGKPGWAARIGGGAPGPAAPPAGQIEQFLPPRQLHCSLPGINAEPVDVAVLLDGAAIWRGTPRLLPDQQGRVSFVVALPSDLAPDDLLDRVSVQVSAEGGEPTPLAMNPMLRAALRLSRGLALLDEVFSTVPARGTAALMRRVGHYASRAQRTRIAPLLVARCNADLPAPSAALSTSPVLLPVGLRSPDGAAIIGREGYLYVVGGSNDVEGLFSGAMPDEQVAAQRDAWVRLVEARARRIASLGACFVQLVVPEKISAVPACYPTTVATPSRLLAALDAALAQHATLAAHYVSGPSLLCGAEGPALYRRTDSHLSPRGAHALAAAIMRALGLAVPDAPAFDTPIIASGDLGAKFFGYPLYEEILTAAAPAGAASRRVVDRVAPASGGHVGTRVVVRNEAAPVAATLVAFGNSFLDRHEEQSSASFWLSCWFRELHFVFSPAVDLDYAAAVRPDFVIGQTIERYLREVPAA
jgi:alginate O-acetyltransferase complex protein AlgJ